MRSSSASGEQSAGTSGDKAQIGKRDSGARTGTLSIVSLGPGSPDHMTPRAREALDSSQVVVGYKTYVSLAKPVLGDQEIVSTGMKGEMERCKRSVERTLAGEDVAIISSGDAGIYGMAGLILELCETNGLRVGPKDARDVDLYLDLVPGIPALAAGASLLGAPLMHDFASISLSDLLTPWEVIERRIKLAAQGDFVVVFYNPKSAKRDWQLDRAIEILLEDRGPDTPVGIVQRAMREGQDVTVTTLADLPSHDIDMQTIVTVGNSATKVYSGYMITPRGYMDKYSGQGNVEKEKQ